MLIVRWGFRFLGLYQQGRVWFAGGGLDLSLTTCDV